MPRVLIVSPHFPPVNAADHQRVRMSLPYLPVGRVNALPARLARAVGRVLKQSRKLKVESRNELFGESAIRNPHSTTALRPGVLFDDPLSAALVTMPPLCHNEHMKRISMRELHMQTGEWVRRAAQTNGVIVLERGQPVATILPFRQSDAALPFAQRRLVQGFAGLPKLRGDSVTSISEDRDRG